MELSQFLPACPEYYEEVIISDSSDQPSCSYQVIPEPLIQIRKKDVQTIKYKSGIRNTSPTCYVEPSRCWTYKSEFDNCLENGQLFYAPNPFRPVPASRGGPSAVERMHHAAKRIDSTKYRGQQAVLDEAKERNMECANCEKCNMRFFMPYNHMRSRISYATTKNGFDLPEAYFSCPMCHHENQIIDYNKEYYF